MKTRILCLICAFAAAAQAAAAQFSAGPLQGRVIQMQRILPPPMLRGFVEQSERGSSMDLLYQYPKYDFGPADSILRTFQHRRLSDDVFADGKSLLVKGLTSDADKAKASQELETARFEGEAALKQMKADLYALKPRWDTDRSENAYQLHAEMQRSDKELARINTGGASELRQLKAELAQSDQEFKKELESAGNDLDRFSYEQEQYLRSRDADWSRKKAARDAQIALWKEEQELKRATREGEREILREQMSATHVQVTSRVAPLDVGFTPDAAELTAEPHWKQSVDVIPGQEPDSELSWDEWYARLSGSVRQPLLDALARHGNPPGFNTIWITVWRDHRLAVAVTVPGNAEFDAAVVEAYRSLDGHESLEYPAGSRRNVVNFFTDHHHDNPGRPTTIQSEHIKGDREYHHGW